MISAVETTDLMHKSACQPTAPQYMVKIASKDIFFTDYVEVKQNNFVKPYNLSL